MARVTSVRVEIHEEALRALLWSAADRVYGIGDEMAADATSQAQAHGGGQYGCHHGGEHRPRARVYTDDFYGALDNHLHQTLSVVAGSRKGR